MTGRLIVISNRIPTGATPSGGLVVAINDTLAHAGGIWIGSHPDAGDEEGLFEIAKEPYQRLAFRLSEKEYQEYYLGYANSVLWPMCHRRGDLVDLERQYETTYVEVNARVARLVAEIAQPDDEIWVHDYHFFPLGKELRKLGVNCKMGFFLHIPFPALGDLRALREPDEFPSWLAAYDLVGLQTKGDVARCLEMFRSERKAEFMTDGAIKYCDRVFGVRSFPIGIDVESFVRASQAEEVEAPFGPDMPGEVLIGIDRLDYSKGLPNRFLAFGRYLEGRPDKDRRVSLVQIAPPTREEVSAYRQIREELEELAGRVNGEHAEIDWTPIRYIHRAVDRDRLARLQRCARACLVTSFADGMNLVAKEYVAAQNPEDPGVLILSRLAGAAEELQDALLINPYDIDEISEAICTALDMPLEERKRRHAACLAAVRRSDVSTWSDSFLAALRARPPSLDWKGARRKVQSADGKRKATADT